MMAPIGYMHGTAIMSSEGRGEGRAGDDGVGYETRR